ncbi:MAG: DUF5329 domain-containing protein, partial [Massilia sp.]
MTFVRSCFAFLSAAVLSAAAHAAPPQAEISHLLDYLAKSGCEFNRNGSWYAGPTARAHLQDKADYLAKRHQLPSAEAFIKLAATESSVSGKAYQVRCGAAAPVPSATWLGEELKRYR